jgi:glycerophosphoryl diester phosphodiesterase
LSIPVTAHRGLARLYPENTRASVLGAHLAGLDKVEIDIQLTADRVPVVYHDPSLLRVSGRAGDIRKKTWDQLKGYRACEPGRFGRRFATERISRLDDLAQAFAVAPKATLFVELKEESLRPFGRALMLQAVAEALKPIHAQCVLISFDVPVLSLARELTRFKVGPVLRSLRQLQSPAHRALKPEWVFGNARLMPRQGSLKALFGSSRSCLYEVPEVDRARAFLKRGISALETFAADSLAQELRLFR